MLNEEFNSNLEVSYSINIIKTEHAETLYPTKKLMLLGKEIPNIIFSDHSFHN